MHAGLIAGFWTGWVAQGLVVVLVAAAACVVGWLLFGAAVRARKDRAMAVRMASVTRSATADDFRPGNGWIPGRMSSFGKRFADARGFSSRMDVELEAAGATFRSGEFVVLSVVAAFVGVPVDCFPAIFGHRKYAPIPNRRTTASVVSNK